MMLYLADPHPDTVRILNEGMAFQEYHPKNPHKKFTLGFVGKKRRKWCLPDRLPSPVKRKRIEPQ